MLVLKSIYNFFKKAILLIVTSIRDFGVMFGKGTASLFRNTGIFFKDFWLSVKEGDVFVKLSLIIMGMGYFKRKQIVRGVLITLFQIAVIVMIPVVFGRYLIKFNTLGTVKREYYFDPILFRNVFNDYDHSFKILLYSLIAFVIIITFIVIYLRNIIEVRKLQLAAENGEHIKTFKEDLKDMLDSKFHVTLLGFPILGIIFFTVIPLFVMILVAFTNYDTNHIVPENLFTWVGFANFKNLFSNSLTITFGYSFARVLSWTLIWAFFATITTYFGGVFLAMLINNKKTKIKRVWRTIFVVTIAVPQFVSLLLVRNFFSDTGIVNTICADIGLTEVLKEWGWIKGSHIPFLTDPNWAKAMIIIINFWIGVPYLMLISTGILMNIPQDLYECAKIDGANGFQLFRHITMPYLLFVTGPFLITSFIHNLNNFNVIYLLTNDVYITADQLMANSHAKETDLLVTWLYSLTQDYNNYKMASVIGICVFVICAIITLITFNITIRGSKEEKFQA